MHDKHTVCINTEATTLFAQLTVPLVFTLKVGVALDNNYIPNMNDLCTVSMSF